MCTMDNTPERLELVHKLTAIMNEDCPYVLLSHAVAFSLAQPWAQRVRHAIRSRLIPRSNTPPWMWRCGSEQQSMN